MTPRSYGGHTNVAPLRRVLVYPPVAPDESASWEAFGYLRPFDQERAIAEHAAFRALLTDAGAEVLIGELDNPALQDGIFPYDPVIITDAGAILGWPGKPLREAEVATMEATLNDLGVPIAGRIVAPGTFEGGDSFWLGRSHACRGPGLPHQRSGDPPTERHPCRAGSVGTHRAAAALARPGGVPAPPLDDQPDR